MNWFLKKIHLFSKIGQFIGILFGRKFKRSSPNYNLHVQEGNPSKLFFEKKFKKSNWEKKFGSFGPKFRRGFLTKFHQYKKNISRGKKRLFLRKLLFFVFLLSCLTCELLCFWRKNPSRSSKRAPKSQTRKLLFGQKKEKKWQLSNNSPDFLPKIMSGVVKIAI